jgi:hypothetical protein
VACATLLLSLLLLQFDRPTSLPTLLGTYNERDQNQLRKPLSAVLAEETAPPGKKQTGAIQRR